MEERREMLKYILIKNQKKKIILFGGQSSKIKRKREKRYVHKFSDKKNFFFWILCYQKSKNYFIRRERRMTYMYSFLFKNGPGEKKKH